MEDALLKLATGLGVPGMLIYAAVVLGRPMVKVWAAREEARTHALEVTVDGVRRILGELRGIRRRLSIPEPGAADRDDLRD